MEVLITGGLGYLGGRLSEHLHQQGAGVRIVTRRPPESVPRRAHRYRVFSSPLWDAPSLSAAVDGVDAVFHLAAPEAGQAAKDPAAAMRAGGEQTWQMLQAVAGRGGPAAWLNLSTVHVYGPAARGKIDETTPPDPRHPYAVGHLFSEIVTRRFALERGIPALNVRLSNLFGRPAAPDAARWELVFNDLCRQAAAGGTIRLRSSGGQQRNFMTLEDGVRALCFLLERREDWPADRVIHVGGTEHWSILKAAEMVALRCRERFGRKPDIAVAAGKEEQTPLAISFDVSRLQALGFSWKNRYDVEIDGTLDVCRQWENLP